MKSALRCSGLVKRYDDVVAVNGIDLEIPRGECFGLLGPNGAGKTTTVEMFEGLLEPDSGEIEVLGHHWGRHDREIRERIGIALQETEYQDKLTVLETARLFRSFYREGPDPEDVLKTVELEEKSGAWVRNLSGGQRQRLSVSCALVGNPEVLFLDEPTTGLDPHSRRQIWEVIGSFRAGGGTVLLTTHYMEEAQRLCDRVAIIDHGRVIALDTPANLIASLGAEHVVEFSTEEMPEIEALRALPHVQAVRSANGTISVTVGEVHQAVPAIIAELERQGAELTRLATHHATLEDVFVALTGRQLEP
ncbi:MAG: ABC transporter ATP-binding protein [Acidobacteriota bacterium]|nr:ABC transporter ATP-binding protein [Acidobacteriota bacterium]